MNNTFAPARDGAYRWSTTALRVLLVLTVFILCGNTTNAQSVRGTIAFVDYEQVFTNYFKTRLANDQLHEMVEGMNRERNIMLIQFDQLQSELKDLRSQILNKELSEDDLRKLRRSVDAKVVELRNQETRISTFNEWQAKRWEEQNRRIRGNLMAEIREKTASLYKARGYLAVIDLSQANDKGVPSVLYLDERANITRDVITEINK